MARSRRERRFMCMSRVFFQKRCDDTGELFVTDTDSDAKIYLCQVCVVKYLLRYHHIEVYAQLVMDGLKDATFDYNLTIIKVVLLAHLNDNGSDLEIHYEGVLDFNHSDAIFDWDSLPNEVVKQVVDTYKGLRERF